MKNIKIKYLVVPFLTALSLLFLGLFFFRYLNTIPLTPFTSQPEEIINDFIEVNNELNKDEKNIPVPEEDLRKNLLDQVIEIKNIKNDFKPFEENEKFVRYMGVYNVLLARYNSTHDDKTRNILIEFQRFLHANYKLRYEKIEKEQPEIWKISE